MANTWVSRSPSETTEVKSEAGLAEWTSKIKAMQRQVDADEEAEQTRLEQEIAASRLARKRRSQGLGYANRSNPDVSRTDSETLDPIPKDIPKISDESDALQRPTGSPINVVSSYKDLKRSSASPEVSLSSVAQPMSLAAFMGGSATGPRLRRHAPQQDAHDPTQFQQHDSNHTPHPAFGTGGVAMPGIVVQRDGPVKPSAIAALTKTKVAAKLPDASAVDPEVYRRQPSATRNVNVRERTTSVLTPAPSTLVSSTKSATPVTYNSRGFHEAPSLSTTGQDRSFRAYNTSPSPLNLVNHGHSKEPRIHSEETPSPLKSYSTPTHTGRPRETRVPTDEILTPSKSPYTAPPLAGPIHPQPRPSVSGPQTPASATPSKAFTRQPAQKELTPSLSRLQGRGFVQSMVKVSSQFESPPAILEVPEKSKSLSERRVSSVLDRWQANVPTTTPSPSPSPSHRLARRSVTLDPKKDAVPQLTPTDSSRKSLKTAISQPSLRQENIPPKPSPSSKPNVLESSSAAGPGSATTLVVYKPTPAIDEFGVRPSRASLGASLDYPTPSKALSHPTKERARKPRKRVASTSPADISAPPLNATQAPNRVSATSDGALAASISSRKNDQVISEKSMPRPDQEQSPLRPSEEPIHPLKPNLDYHHTHPDVIPSRPNAMPVSHSSDGHRLIRRALPGFILPEAERKFPPSEPIVQPPTPETVNHGLARRALPGLVPIAKTLQANQLPLQTPVDKKEEPAVMPSPTKPPRIPSTGNRLTVMDVAQALNHSDHDSKQAEEATTPVSTVRPSFVPSPGHPEKRRTSYEKYSSIILPPLKEEATPAPTPTSTLSRIQYSKPARPSEAQQETRPAESAGILLRAISGVTSESNEIKRPAENPLFPNVNFNSLLKYGSRHTHHGDSGSTMISVEVTAITGTTASSLSKGRSIFYDTEVLAVIHRSKSHLTGLVSTSVWGWEGKRATLGAREQRKLQEIAQRYGTTVNIVQQNSEPSQLVHILGGVLAIRQGTRTHWTSENTAMHLVRSLGGVVFIDEKDLNIKNLCSGYSYCISILDSIYVWYGRGSTPLERKAALEYGHSLATAVLPIELTEDGSKDDEMFWMILGDDDYANADYWKWRKSSSNIDPRIWRVKAELGTDCVAHVDFISGEASFHESVYIIDCIWEFYVVVGSRARAHKDDIELALSVATELSAQVSSTRPYAPTVHTLILPSQLPRDLRLIFRDLDEFSMNKSEIPDHMNILSSAEAYQHLKTDIWDAHALQDRTLLPLGIDS